MTAKETGLRMKLTRRKAEWRNRNPFVLDGFIKLLEVHTWVPPHLWCLYSLWLLFKTMNLNLGG